MADEGTQPEEQFVKLFAEVCGIDKVALLVPQFPDDGHLWEFPIH